jgi:hypothetical protein
MNDSIAFYLNISPISTNELKNINDNLNLLKTDCGCYASGWNKGILTGPRSEEDKLKISNTLKGHNVSEETRVKISEKIKINNKLGINGFSLGHANIAGKKGGRSKSEEKIKAVLSNQQKSLETIRNSIWMIDKETNKRKRVPASLINEYESLGFVKGFR